MPGPTLYLFDGYNLMHAGGIEDVRELTDLLASFVALRGARGVLVFDGVGPETAHGPLEVRYAPNADTLIERLAADHRDAEAVCLVSSDVAVRGTSGQQVSKLSSKTFLRDLEPILHDESRRSEIAGQLDDATRAKLERLRRNLGS
jgi:predicted RNA-binding protein with PIN domain